MKKTKNMTMMQKLTAEKTDLIVTYQIKLGPMMWDCDEEKFRPIDRWDLDGSYISAEKISSESRRAMEKSENIHGWEIEILHHGKEAA